MPQYATRMCDTKYRYSMDTSDIHGGAICTSPNNSDENMTFMCDSKFDSTHRIPRPKHRDVQSKEIDTWYRPSNPYQVGIDMFDTVAGNTRINNEKGKMCMEEDLSCLNKTFMCDSKFDQEEYGDYANTRRQKFVPDDEY